MDYPNDNYLQNYLRNAVLENRKIIRDLRRDLQGERFKNLRMRLDLMVLMERPLSTAAQRIRRRYNLDSIILNKGIEIFQN
jgi:hypothetical protein